MEQKRTLWIIAAAGVFLLVVIGAALILYSPARTRDPAIASLQGQNDTWTLPPVSSTVPSLPEQPSVSTVSGTEQTPGSSAKNVDELTVISGTTTVYGTGSTVIDINALKSPATAQSAAVTPLNQAAADAVSAAGAASGTTARSSEPQQTSVPAASAAPAVAEKKTATQSAASAKPSAAAEKKPADAGKLPDQYWVQVASFASKKNAEEARTALLDNKIASEIFTYSDSANKVYYRLRVGPYTTKTEAEYWRSRIVLIDEFSASQSYVTNSTAPKNK
ncbi:SPOR domain-containing protein [Treponema brennaborense]|uniref:Sporulation domain-containing protein n=1 Tax=Treponema brennaborense (strain DSM 12168 / CIP 105900 / DD5/3) TaxID=906968 RepID=F4LK27_TREBD|nr:SPOR domain-containing protein [Treponema brennaborense]AEE17489.1 Sporulation domain-containing protein [Treponema brennaborense DSM 12168]